MKMLKTIFLMCGPAGAGKSTWATHRIKVPQAQAWVSRDNIRFILVGENEDYFSKEDEVFESFIESIQAAIDDRETKEVYIDATHLNEKARNKVLDRLDLAYCQIIPVVIKPDLNTILAQNDKREGRAFVPRSVVRRMDVQFQKPTFNEKHHYAEIWFPQPDGKGIVVVPNNGGNR
jgi:predicted kinase